MLRAGWRELNVSTEVDQEIQLSALDLIPLQSRIHTVGVVELLNELVNRVVNMLEARNQEELERLFGQISPVHNQLHDLLGRSIKQLEDENQQLGDPPAG